KAMVTGERFDLGIFLQILGRDVLNVVIDCENRLCRIRDSGGADLLELWNHGAGVVMGHDVARTNGNKITCAHHGSRSEAISVSCGNFLDECEIHINLNEVVSDHRKKPVRRTSTINCPRITSSPPACRGTSQY